MHSSSSHSQRTCLSVAHTRQPNWPLRVFTRLYRMTSLTRRGSSSCCCERVHPDVRHDLLKSSKERMQ